MFNWKWKLVLFLAFFGFIMLTAINNSDAGPVEWMEHQKMYGFDTLKLERDGETVHVFVSRSVPADKAVQARASLLIVMLHQGYNYANPFENKEADEIATIRHDQLRGTYVEFKKTIAKDDCRVSKYGLHSLSVMNKTDKVDHSR